MKTIDKPYKTDDLLSALGIALLVLAIVMFFTSCSSVASAISGQPIPSTAVQRVNDPTAPIIQVATADITIAEQGDPAAVHGLYDAGFLAKRAREAVIDATK